MPTPSKKTLEEFDYAFSPISKLFGINKDTMNTHWLELGCLKRHSNKIDFQ